MTNVYTTSIANWHHWEAAWDPYPSFYSHVAGNHLWHPLCPETAHWRTEIAYYWWIQGRPMHVCLQGPGFCSSNLFRISDRHFQVNTVKPWHGYLVWSGKCSANVNSSLKQPKNKIKIITIKGFKNNTKSATGCVGVSGAWLDGMLAGSHMWQKNKWWLLV